MRDSLPELAARHEFDGWWITVCCNGQTRSPEAMIQWLTRNGWDEPAVADHVAAAILRANPIPTTKEQPNP